MDQFEAVGSIKPHDEPVRGISRGDQLNPVYLQEREGRGKRGPLVSIDERVVLCKAFPECRRLIQQVRIVSGLWPVQSCFNQPEVPDAMSPAIAFDLILVNRQDVSHGEIISHSASFL